MNGDVNWIRRIAPWVVALILTFPVVGAAAQLLTGKGKFFQLKCESLQGCAVTHRPSTATLDLWLSATFQRDFEQWFSSNFGARNLLVRLNNELTYRLFRRSYMYRGKILTDDEGTLYSADYLSDYYHACDSQDRARITALVSDLARLQNSLRHHGIAFAYLITPSKASLTPATISIPTARPAGHRIYNELVKQLQEQHITFVDGHQITADLIQRGYPQAYTQGGIHWTDAAASRTFNAVVASLNSQLKRSAFSLVQSGKPTMEAPDAIESDLANLMNLLRPFAEYQTMHTSFTAADSAGKSESTLVIEGGSFCGQLMNVVEKANAAKSMRHFFYFTKALRSWPDGRHLENIDPSSIDCDRDILSADAIVLENNEALVFDHNKQFAEYVLQKLDQKGQLAKQGTTL